MNKHPTFEEALPALDEHAISIGETTYWRLHKPRFIWTAQSLLEMAAFLLGNSKQRLRVLDIGNSFQTILFSKALPDAQIDTLGFFDHRFPTNSPSHHYNYDLNETDSFESWPSQQGGFYDFITFMEVLEHLYTSPLFVLSFLKTLLTNGGRIILQTPNAVSLRKRRRLLFGSNPYELLRTNRQSPGHFHEYTAKDLERYARLTGFEIECSYHNGFLVDGNHLDRACDRISRFLPKSFRSGITIVLRKANNDCIRNLDTLPIA